VIDRHEIGTEQPLKIQDTRIDHNSGCTDLQLIPMFDQGSFPYVLSRNRFKIDLIDIKSWQIYTLCNERNTP